MKKEKTYFIEKYESLIPTKMDKWKTALPLKVAEKFVKEYTKKNGVVLDPFAGFGIVLLACKRQGRKAIGIEINKNRVEFVKKKFGIKLIHGNSLKLEKFNLPKIDACITSPPYWAEDTKDLDSKNYEQYLNNISKLFLRINRLLRKKGRVIIFLQNIPTKQGLQTLAWDIVSKLKKIYRLEQDIIWCVDRSKKPRDKLHEPADHHYCLIFRKR